jgi:hypothetical protein
MTLTVRRPPGQRRVCGLCGGRIWLKWRAVWHEGWLHRDCHLPAVHERARREILGWDQAAIDRYRAGGLQVSTPQPTTPSCDQQHSAAWPPRNKPPSIDQASSSEAPPQTLEVPPR